MPGTSGVNLTTVAPPAGTCVVWMSVAGGALSDPSGHTRSKISPITWKLLVRLGPPSPKKMWEGLPDTRVHRVRSIPGVRSASDASAQRQCLEAVAQGLAEDMGKFLSSQP